MSEYFHRSPVHFFDVALRQPFLSDHFDPNSISKLLTPQQQHLTTFIGKIYPSGTCFVFSKPKGKIFIRNQRVLAFALTNFHVVYDIMTRKVNDRKYVSFDFSDNPNVQPHSDNLNYDYIFSPILEFQTKLTGKQLSDNSNFYCLPNDIAILAIYQSIPFSRRVPDFESCLNFHVLSLAECHEISDYNEEQVIISGYPTGTNSINYMIPDSHDIPNADVKVRNGFHNFKHQVISEGFLKLPHTGMAQLQLSSTSGMSGSPILSGTARDSKVLGIYCGGPPLEGQLEIIEVVRHLIDKKYENAYEVFLTLPFEDSSLYESMDFYKSFKKSVLKICFLVGSEEIKASILSKDPEIENRLSKICDPRANCETILTNLQNMINPLLISTVGNYKNKDIFNYNIGISAETEAFIYIRQFQRIVEHLDFECDSEEAFNSFILSRLNLN